MSPILATCARIVSWSSISRYLRAWPPCLPAGAVVSTTYVMDPASAP